MSNASRHGQTRRIPVSVMVFTLNEEVNIDACLGSVRFSDDIIVVDSFSQDTTVERAERHGARVFQNVFEGFGEQRNWALNNTNPKYEWILILDADERATPELEQELQCTLPIVGPETAGFLLSRRFYMWGKWLKHSSLYPTYVVRLIRRHRVRYLNRGHAETQRADGALLKLESDLIDENAKGLCAWFERQVRYAREDAKFELESTERIDYSLFFRDPLVRRAALKRVARYMPFRPFWYFMFSYFWKLGFLDGRAGFVFCYMRSTYQAMISINKYDLTRKK